MGIKKYSFDYQEYRFFKPQIIANLVLMLKKDIHLYIQQLIQKQLSL